jgi:hypothetical protein
VLDYGLCPDVVVVLVVVEFVLSGGLWSVVVVFVDVELIFGVGL